MSDDAEPVTTTAPEPDAAMTFSARGNTRWIVLGQGLDRKLGEGLVLVVEHQTGQVVRVVNRGVIAKAP